MFKELEMEEMMVVNGGGGTNVDMGDGTTKIESSKEKEITGYKTKGEWHY